MFTTLIAKAYAGLGLLLAVLLGSWWLLHEHDVARDALRDAAQIQADQTETQRRIAAQNEVNNESQRLASKDRDAAARLAAAAGVLRPQVAALVRACSAAAPGVGPAASSPGDLLAYVQGRVGPAIAATVDYAASAARAGSECSALYDSLTPPGAIP